jgi:hypothetical protein
MGYLSASGGGVGLNCGKEKTYRTLIFKEFVCGDNGNIT